MCLKYFSIYTLFQINQQIGMQIYFASKTGKPSKLLFNSNQPQKQSQPQQAPRQMAVSRKSILMQDKEQTLKDKIKIDVVGIVPSRLKINPDIYAFNISSLLENQKIQNIDILDQIQLRNKQKQESYEQLMTISKEISNMGQTKTVIKRPHQYEEERSPIGQIMNLIGCTPDKAKIYLQRYGSVEKAYSGYETQQMTIKEFVRRYRISEENAKYCLEQTNYNISQAARLLQRG